MITKGQIYRHYKGAAYQVLCTARHTETEEEFVVYSDVQSPEKVWIRPRSMFEEEVQIGDKKLPRFTLLA